MTVFSSYCRLTPLSRVNIFPPENLILNCKFNRIPFASLNDAVFLNLLLQIFVIYSTQTHLSQVKFVAISQVLVVCGLFVVTIDFFCSVCLYV